MNFISHKPIHPEIFFIPKPSPDSGALTTFFGMVRNHHEGRAVRRLYYECYASMADKEIFMIRKNAIQRWPLTDVRILHRVGLLEIGDIALAVAVASAHRTEAFEACEAIVDEIKVRVPIWKKEFYADFTSQWVLCGHHGGQSSTFDIPISILEGMSNVED